MLVDNITLTIKAGNGGNGAATFIRNSQTAKGGPDGGNGGNGGNIYFQGSNNIYDLAEFRFKKKITADSGIPGKKQNLYGKNALHTTILVPIGTEITNLNSKNKPIEITNTKPILLARGGAGGRGNTYFKSATNQAPTQAELGTTGEEKTLHLSLKLIADIGLIGLPNAGKSSLLNVLTRAKSKIGDYPFTTLEPSIGMFGKYPIADIPGLIEGASDGRGLGIQFLQHIEKTKVLVHCIDASIENPDLSYETIHNEFKKYNSLLLEKKEIIVLTKSDLATGEQIKTNQKLLKKRGKEVYVCSIYNEKSINTLKELLNKMLADSNY